MRSLFKKLNTVLPSAEKKRIVALIVAMVIGGLMELAGVSAVFPLISIMTSEDGKLPAVLLRFLPETVAANRTELVVVLALALIVIYILKNLYIVKMYDAIFSFTWNGTTRTATDTMDLFMHAPYSIFLQMSIPELQRVVQVDVIGTYRVLEGVLQIMSEGVICLILAILLVVASPIMTLFLFVLLAAVDGFYLIHSRKKAKKLGEEQLKEATEEARVLLDSFSSIKELKVLGREKYFIKRYSEQRKRLARTGKGNQMLVILPRPLTETICICGVMAILIFVSLRGGNVADMIPVLAVFAVAAFRMLPSVGKINGFISNMTYGMPALNDLYSKMGEIEELRKAQGLKKSDEGETELKFEKEMELKNVTFLYKTGRKILDEVTLKIKKGETVGIIGGSGAGKTTLVDVIMGLLVPEKGKVLSDGTDIQGAMRKWHSFIGYVPQTIYLSNATVRENVAFGIEPDRIDDEKVEKALKMAQAWSFVQDMPEKTDTFIGDRGMRISGGQRQRIGIARALYMEPQILVFDEATASLDGETEKALMDSISSLKGGHTMIIIAHRLETLKDCNKIYEVKDGKVTSAFEKVKGRN